jgi:hypothetical protein
VTLSGTSWNLVTVYQLTNLTKDIVRDLAAVISVPPEWIVIDSLRIGSLIIQYTVRRNGTFFIDDSVINNLVQAAPFTNTVDLYKNTTLLTNDNVAVTSVVLLLPSVSSTSSAASGCTGTCIAAVGAAVGGGIMLTIAVIIITIKLRRRLREKRRQKRNMEDGIGDVADHVTPRQNPIRHEPFTLRSGAAGAAGGVSAARLPENQASPFHMRSPLEPVYYFHSDDLTTSDNKKPTKAFDDDYDEDDPANDPANKVTHFGGFYDDDDEDPFRRSDGDVHFVDIQKHDDQAQDGSGGVGFADDYQGDDAVVHNVQDEPDGDIIDVTSVGSSTIRSARGPTAQRRSSPVIPPPPPPRGGPPANHQRTSAHDSPQYVFRSIRAAADVSGLGQQAMAMPAALGHPLAADETSSLYEGDDVVEDDGDDAFEYEYEWVEAPTTTVAEDPPVPSHATTPRRSHLDQQQEAVQAFTAIYRDDEQEQPFFGPRRPPASRQPPTAPRR